MDKRSFPITPRMMIAGAGVLLLALVGLPALLTGQNRDGAAPDAAAVEPAAASAEALDPASVVVTVNGETLTQGKVDTHIAQRLNAMRSRGLDKLPPEQRAQFRESVRKGFIESFVAVTLLTGEAERRELQVTPEQVDKEMTQVESRLPDGMSTDALLERLNITMAEFRRDLERELKLRQLIDQVTADKIAVTDAEITAFYTESEAKFKSPESVHARHVLFELKEDADQAVKDAQKAAAAAARAEIVGGADFAAVAKDRSNCPSSSRGGDLGSFPRGRMVPAFDEAAFAQEVDEIGPVVETRFG